LSGFWCRGWRSWPGPSAATCGSTSAGPQLTPFGPLICEEHAVVLPPLWCQGHKGQPARRISALGAIIPGPRKRASGSGGRTEVARALSRGPGSSGASEMATGVVVGSAVILAPGRRRRLAPRRSRRSASCSTTSAHQPSPDHRPDRITGSTPRPSRGRERVGTKDSRHRRRLWTPRAPQPEHEGWRPRRGCDIDPLVCQRFCHNPRKVAYAFLD
jgi:hypothetical protein